MVRTATSERGYEEHYSSSCSTRETCEAACAAVNGGTTSASSGALSSCSCVPPTYVQRTCFSPPHIHNRKLAPVQCILPTRPLNMCWVLTTAFILPSIRPEHGRHSGHQCPRAVSNMGTEAIKTHSQNAKYRRRVLIPFTQLSTVNWKTSVLKMIAVTPSFASFWLLVIRRHGLWMRWHCYCHVIQTGFR